MSGNKLNNRDHANRGTGGMVHVVLPGLLADAFAAPRHLEVRAGRLGELMAALDSAYPGLRERLVELDGRVREHVNLFVDDLHVRDAGPDLPLADGAQVRFVASIAGGVEGDG